MKEANKAIRIFMTWPLRVVVKFLTNINLFEKLSPPGGLTRYRAPGSRLTSRAA